MEQITGINLTTVDGIARGMQKLQAAAREIATAPGSRAKPNLAMLDVSCGAAVDSAASISTLVDIDRRRHT
jgi:hypothetical protein